MTIAVQLDGQIVAFVGATRFHLAPHIAALPEGDGQRLLVTRMCEYALSVQRSGGTYSDTDAVAWASRTR